MYKLPITINEYICQECGTKFYTDRKRETMSCPNCEHTTYINEEDISITSTTNNRDNNREYTYSYGN